ncbi:hypothetical protein CcCBS67573_g07739 [Chytriomyces confervae]|uniref:Reelin domain-containing protein n=1 Tax=Chytriomyces confervae TaxID=246404 RepID=A0A507ES42_9FUNG|nr:hypothetical protein HDU80_002994 [Chytriomyces hyalinus]TPX66671.1 hypothetical protein CcCBS67573_g07739 [Chytriomyces confervae]
MQLLQFYLSAALSLLSLTATCLPNGAPRCKITESIIAQGHKIPQGSLGLVMKLPATYTPGGRPIPITITSATGAPVKFAGILAYVTTGAVQDSVLTAKAGGPTVNGVAAHVGRFRHIRAQQLRPQTAALCTALNVKNAHPKSTITHSVPLNATTPFTIMWSPPRRDKGVVTVNVVISSGSSKSPWQIVPSGQIQSVAATAGHANANANAKNNAKSNANAKNNAKSNKANAAKKATATKKAKA